MQHSLEKPKLRKRYTMAAQTPAYMPGPGNLSGSESWIDEGEVCAISMPKLRGFGLSGDSAVRAPKASGLVDVHLETLEREAV